MECSDKYEDGCPGCGLEGGSWVFEDPDDNIYYPCTPCNTLLGCTIVKMKLDVIHVMLDG